MKSLTITILVLSCLLFTGCTKEKEQERYFCENYYNRAEGIPTAETDNLYIFADLKYLKTQCVESKKYINE